MIASIDDDYQQDDMLLSYEHIRYHPKLAGSRKPQSLGDDADKPRQLRNASGLARYPHEHDWHSAEDDDAPMVVHSPDWRPAALAHRQQFELLTQAFSTILANLRTVTNASNPESNAFRLVNEAISSAAKIDSSPTIQVFGFNIPSPLKQLAETIEESREILSLGPDWDGNGAVPCHEETWRGVVEFLAAGATETWERYDVQIPMPYIELAADGSIHLDWEGSKRELLIVVPRDAEQPPNFYGDEPDKGLRIKGTLRLKERNDWLFLWLVS